MAEVTHDCPGCLKPLETLVQDAFLCRCCNTVKFAHQLDVEALRAAITPGQIRECYQEDINRGKREGHQSEGRSRKRRPERSSRLGKPESEKLKVTFALRVAMPELERIQRAADRAHVSLSQMVRWAFERCDVGRIAEFAPPKELTRGGSKSLPVKLTEDHAERMRVLSQHSGLPAAEVLRRSVLMHVDRKF